MPMLNGFAMRDVPDRKQRGELLIRRPQNRPEYNVCPRLGQARAHCRSLRPLRELRWCPGHVRRSVREMGSAEPHSFPSIRQSADCKSLPSHVFRRMRQTYLPPPLSVVIRLDESLSLLPLRPRPSPRQGPRPGPLSDAAPAGIQNRDFAAGPRLHLDRPAAASVDFRIANDRMNGRSTPGPPLPSASSAVATGERDFILLHSTCLYVHNPLFPTTSAPRRNS